MLWLYANDCGLMMWSVWSGVLGGIVGVFCDGLCCCGVGMVGLVVSFIAEIVGCVGECVVSPYMSVDVRVGCS